MRALRASGHAGIATPIASYLGDPIAYTNPAQAVAATDGLSAASAYAGVQQGTLKQRWRRSPLSRGSDVHDGRIVRMRSALSLTPPKWNASLRSPPPQYRPAREGLSWKAVGQVMAALAAGCTAAETARHTDVAITNVEAIQRRCSELEQRTGWDLGTSPRTLSPPRHTRSTGRLLTLIDREDRRLGALCEELVHCARIPAPQNTCVLIAPEAALSLRQIASEAGFVAQELGCDRGGTTYILARNGTRPYGAMNAVRWVCAVTWVSTRLGDDAVLDANRSVEGQSG